MSAYPKGALVRAEAMLSNDEVYRYRLHRAWSDMTLEAEPETTATFVMLNPSTADGTADDPTIRRCVGFARAMGCNRLVVVNLFAWRATKPADLWGAFARGVDVVGPENDSVIWRAVREGDGPIVAAWGAHGARWPERVRKVAEMLPRDRVRALSVTASGEPGHPLMLPATCQPRPWQVAS